MFEYNGVFSICLSRDVSYLNKVFWTANDCSVLTWELMAVIDRFCWQFCLCLSVAVTTPRRSCFPFIFPVVSFKLTSENWWLWISQYEGNVFKFSTLQGTVRNLFLFFPQTSHTGFGDFWLDGRYELNARLWRVLRLRSREENKATIEYAEPGRSLLKLVSD